MLRQPPVSNAKIKSRVRGRISPKIILQLLGVTLWLLGSWGWAQACADVIENRQELIIENFGTAYFASLPVANLQAGEATLADGVCIAGEEGWELRSEILSVRGIGEAFSLEASNVSLLYFDWQVNAASLVAVEGSIEISEVDFASASLTGTSQEAVFDLSENVLSLKNAAAQGEGFRIQGELARLSGDVLFFEDAIATTCVCEEGALYIIRSPTASYDLTEQAVVVKGGQLDIGGVMIELPDIDLSQEKLANIAFPITIEYIGDDEAEDIKGTGLGLRVSDLALSDDLTLELGLAGLDVEYPLVGVAVLHYKDEKTNFDVGVTSRGVQADFGVREPLTPWLDLSFNMRNRDWQAADFLHEGSLGLVAKQRYVLSSHTLGFTVGAFAAASSQTIASEIVTSPRLGSYASAGYRSPSTDWGQFSLQLRAEATRYPTFDAAQFGLRFQPTWSMSFNPVRVSLGWDRLVTNAASPFDTSLDKLVAKSELSLGLNFEDDFAPGLAGSFGVSVRYDFLGAAPGEGLGGKLEAFAFQSTLDWQREGLKLRPFLSAELAPVFNDSLDGVDAFVEGGVTLERGRVQGGFSLRFDPTLDESLEKIELSTSFPLDFGTVTLEPFLAFDMLPTIRDFELPRLSGQGLKVTWRSCCGTVIASYKRVENSFSTSFAFQLSEP